MELPRSTTDFPAIDERLAMARVDAVDPPPVARVPETLVSLGADAGSGGLDMGGGRAATGKAGMPFESTEVLGTAAAATSPMF